MCERQIKIRGGHRAEATKLCSKLRELCKRDTADIVMVRILIQEIRRQRDIIVNLDNNILDVIEVNRIDQDIYGASEININIDEVLTIGDRHIEEFQKVDGASERRSRDTANELSRKNVK